MTVRIRSLLTSGPLLVPLSGGETVRLSPGQVTDELDDVQVANNAKVDKLRARQLIDVEEIGPTAAPALAPNEAGEPAAEAETGDGQPAAKTPRRSNRSR